MFVEANCCLIVKLCRHKKKSPTIASLKQKLDEISQLDSNLKDKHKEISNLNKQFDNAYKETKNLGVKGSVEHSGIDTEVQSDGSKINKITFGPGTSSKEKES